LTDSVDTKTDFVLVAGVYPKCRGCTVTGLDYCNASSVWLKLLPCTRTCHMDMENVTREGGGSTEMIEVTAFDHKPITRRSL